MTVVPVRLWRWSHGRSSQGPVVRHRIWYVNPYRPSNAPCSGKTIFLYIWFGDVDVYIYIHRYPPHPTCTWCLFLAGFYLASSHTVQRWIQLISKFHSSAPAWWSASNVLVGLPYPSVDPLGLGVFLVICGLFVRKNWGCVKNAWFFCDVHIFQNSMLYGICMKEILQNPWFFSRLAFLASYDSFTSGSIHIEAFTCILV